MWRRRISTIVNLGFYLFLRVDLALGQNCTTDSDCNVSQNLLCSHDRTCRFLVPTDGFCSSAKDCISYSYFGEEACTQPCSIESQCSLESHSSQFASISISEPTQFCCKAIPTNGSCIATRSKEFSGCARTTSCGKSSAEEETSTCSAPANNWITGVLLSLLGSLTLNLGNNIQKYAFRKNFELPPDQRKTSACSMPSWVVGQLIFISGNVVNMVAFSFAAQSLLAPLGAFSLVTNAVFAPLINKEPFSRNDFLSIVLIICGTTLVVIFADRQDRRNTLCALFKYYTRIQVIILISVCLFLFFMTYLVIKLIEANKAEDEHENSLKKFMKKKHASLVLSPTMAFQEVPEPSISPIVSPTIVPNLSINSPASLIMIERMGSHESSRGLSFDSIFQKIFRIRGWKVGADSVLVRIVLPLSYAFLAAIGGSFTSLFAKSVSEVFNMYFSGSNQFSNPLTYVLVFLLLVFSIIQLYWINEGLKKYDALLQIPVFFTIWTVLSVVMGGVYFDEFSSFSNLQYVFFFIGITVIFSGTFLLSQRLNNKVNSASAEVVNIDESGDDGGRYNINNSAAGPSSVKQSLARDSQENPRGISKLIIHPDD